MKKFLLILTLVAPYLLHAQGTTCADMDPICTDVGASFTANTGTTAEPGNDYGCLATQPNPSWYYFEVATNGNIDMSLSAPSDIDFIIWGPFTDLANAQANCGTLSAGQTVDCSFSATNTETPSIPNAVAGEVYIMLITNYANTVQNVDLTQTGGTGSTDCSIVTNPPCFMSYFDATISACDPATDTYSVTGQIDYDDPPTTGDLIVVDCNGNQVIVASAPFTTNGNGSGSYNYTLNGSNANGAACDVTAYFSTDPTCTMNLTYTAPICLCTFTYMAINQGACDPLTNTFQVSGSVEFQSPPTTGTLTFTDCEGNTDTYFAPFTSPQTYVLPGIIPNGTASCTVTAVFSDDPTCSMTSLPFTDPSSCTCPVDIGSFTELTTGFTNAQYELCFGDSFTWTPNGDFIPHADENIPGTPFLPGIEILLFDCAPTVQPPAGLGTDPCLLGVISNGTGAGGWTVTNTTGDGLTFWYAPVSMYNWQTNTYAIIYSGLNCYDIGFGYPLTFLPEITYTLATDCFTGTATATITGGTPAWNGADFEVVPGSLLPANANFVNTTCPDGGTIVIDGLVDGDVYSFDVLDEHDCPVTITGTFQGLEDASFTYDFKYCQDEADPLPVITGVPGGTFTATPAGMVINGFTGLIDLSASAPGIYTVQYESPAFTCWGTETFVLTINPVPTITPTEDSPICDDGVSTIQLDEVGGDADEWTWSSNGGATFSFDTIQNPVVSGATNGEIFTVVGTNATTGCINSAQIAVTVNPMDDPSFTTTDFCFGDANSATVTGTTGGTFTLVAPFGAATINGATGEISNEAAGTTYTIEYTTNGICPLSSTQTVTVNALPIVATNDVTVCLGGNVDITASGATTYSWSPGTYLNTTVGATVNSTPLADISYTIAGTDGNGCQNTAIANVTVSGNAPIDAGPDVTICDGTATTLTATGGVVYNWDQGLGAGNNFNVTPSATTTYTVNGTDANGCTGIDQIVVTVNPVPTVDPIADQTLCNTTNTTAVNFTGAVAGTTYDWVNNDPSIGLGAAGTGNIGAFAATNAGTTPVIVTITVTPSAIGCTGTPETFTITVNPTPTVDPILDQTVCNGVATTPVAFTGAVGGTTYDWINTNAGIGLGAAGVGNIAGFIGTNAGSAPISGDVTVTPTVNGCVGLPETFTITINPTPIVDPIADQTLCNNDATAAVNFTSATAGTIFDWSNNTPSIGLGAAGTGNIASFTATNSGATPVTGVISVTPTANGCVGTPINFNIIVNPTPTVNPIADETICAGEPSTAVNFTGAVAGTTYDWTNNNPAIGLGAAGTGNIASFNGTNAGATSISGLITITPTANGCVGTPTSYTMTINPLPTATIAGTVDVCENDPQPTVTFTGANGTAPYTFTYNINGGAPLTITSVGNTATINVPTTPTGTFNYNLESVEDASVTNCSQTQAGTATITVNANPVPVITGTAAYCTGTTATLATSVPFTTYNWSTGAVTPTVNVTIANNPITVDVTNAFGCTGTSAAFNVIENTVIVYTSTIEICQGESVMIHGISQSTAGVYDQTFILGTGCDSTASVTLVVNPLPVIDAGLDQTECEGTGIILNATGAPNIVWDIAGVVNGQQFTPGVGTVTYTATGTDANGCVNTDLVDVTINPTPSVDPVVDETLCNTAATTAVNFTGPVAGTVFNWTNNDPSIGLAAAGTGNIASFNAINIGSAPVTATITVTPTANGCPGPSITYTITVNPTPVVDPIADETVCNGDFTTAVNPTSTTAGTTFDWTNTNIGIGLGANGNGSIAAFAGTNAGTAPISGTISVTPTANTCVGTPIDYIVTVNPSPTVDPIADETICNNTATTAVNFTSPTAGTTFDWTNSNTNIGLVGAGAGNIASFTGTNAGVSAISGTITVTPTASGCVGTAETFIITIDPSPTVDPIVDQTICNNTASTAVNFTSPSAGTTFDWTNSNPAIGLGAAGAGNIASFNGTNAGATSISGTITVTPTANGCVGTAETFVITVDPSPVVDPILDQTLCANDNTTAVNFTSATPGTTYDWTNNDPSIGLGAAGAGNINAFAATNGGLGPVAATITVTPTANGCIGAAETFTITVNPAPTVDPIADDELCAGDATNAVVFTSPTAGTTFDWTNNSPTIGLGGAGTGDIASFTGLNAGAAPTVATITVTPTAGGCVGLAETFTITVNPIPNVFAGNDFIICEGSQAILTGSGALNYDWTAPVVNGQAFVPVATGTYTVTGTDANGCINTDDVLVTVEPLPVVSFTADVTSGCAPLTVTFTNTTGGNLTDCVWTFGNGTTLNGCGSVTTTFPNGGLFDVTLTTTSANGCSNSDTYIDYIYVEDNPIASFVPSSSVVSVFNSEILFSNTSTGAVSYEWEFGDNTPMSTVVNPLHEFPNDEAGTYDVQLIAYSSLGCSDTATWVIVVNEELIFYVPNTFTPDHDDFNETFQPVFTSGYDPYDFNMLIFNRWGEVVWESHDASKGWDATYGTDGREVQDGTYTWKIDFKTTMNDERIMVVGHVNVLR